MSSEIGDKGTDGASGTDRPDQTDGSPIVTPSSLPACWTPIAETRKLVWPGLYRVQSKEREKSTDHGSGGD